MMNIYCKRTKDKCELQFIKTKASFQEAFACMLLEGSYFSITNFLEPVLPFSSVILSR
jgi:hypothetical protein